MLESNQALLLDTRSSSAYSGWLVDGSIERGHIPGSRLFSADWIRFLDQAIISDRELKFRQTNLKTKTDHLLRDNYAAIILMDYNNKDAYVVANYLQDIVQCEMYYFNLLNWNGQRFTYPNFQKIVPAEWVNEIIQGNKPAFYETDHYKIFECDWGPHGITYMSSHIPNAFHIDTEDFEQAPAWTHRSLEDLYKFIDKYNIHPDETIILYSNGDQGAEYKTALILEALGFNYVHILNGGYTPWRIKKLNTERGIPKNIPPSSKPANLNINFEVLNNISKIKEYLATNNSRQVVDIRPWEEYRGEITGYDYIPKPGRIPGALYGGSWINYKNVDDTVPDKTHFLNALTKNNLNTTKDMIFFCGSAGWGAAMVYYFGKVFGMDNLSIYEGGWCEWQLDDKNPIDTEIIQSNDHD